MASTNVGSIHYDLSLKTDKFDAAAAGISARTQKIGKSMQSIGKKMTIGISLPIAVGMGFAIKAASDLQETINKIDVAFGTSSGRVKDWSKTSIQSMGLAQQSALDAAALFGDMATSMGLSRDSAADMSMSLVQLGADLASFKNIPFAEAQTALSGVFTGETESLKRLGIVMTETNLQAFALSHGVTKNVSAMSQAEKVQLRYAYIMSVTKNAQGDFVRTGDSTANQIRKNKEMFKQLSAQIGQQLIPIVNKFLAALSKLLDWFSRLSPGVQQFILVMAAILAVIGPLLIIIGSLIGAIGAIATVIGAVSLTAVAIGAVIIAVVLAIAAVVYVVIRNWETLKRWFFIFWQTHVAMFNALKNFIIGVWTGIFNFIVSKMTAAWNFISPILNFIKNIFIIVFGGIFLAVNYYFRMYLMIVNAVMRAIFNVVSSIWNAVYNVISGVVKRIINFFAPAFRWLIGRGRDIIRGLISGISSMVSPLVHAVSSVSARIGQFFRGAAGWLWDTGAAIIRGLINGISSMAGAVYNKAQEIADGVKNRIQNALKIHSPSRVFFGFGQNVVQGFVDGINKSKMAAYEAMDMVTPVSQPASQPASHVNNNHYTINLEGIIARSRGDLREIGKDIISAVNEELRAKSIKELGR